MDGNEQQVPVKTSKKVSTASSSSQPAACMFFASTFIFDCFKIASDSGTTSFNPAIEILKSKVQTETVTPFFLSSFHLIFSKRVMVENKSGGEILAGPYYVEHFSAVINAFEFNSFLQNLIFEFFRFEGNSVLNVSLGGEVNHPEYGMTKFPYARVSAQCGVINLLFYFIEALSDE